MSLCVLSWCEMPVVIHQRRKKPIRVAGKKRESCSLSASILFVLALLTPVLYSLIRSASNAKWVEWNENIVHVLSRRGCPLCLSA